MVTIKKICKWSLLILFAIIVLSSVSLWLFFPVEQAKQFAIDKGEELLGREIQIETASISFWGGIGIKLDNIVIKNKPEFSSESLVEAKSLDVKLHIFALFSGDFAIDRLILTEPHIKLFKRKNGENNYTFKKIDSKVASRISKNITPETKAAAAIVTFENLELQDALLYYKDESADVEVTLTDFYMHSMLTQPFGHQYISSGELSIQSAQILNDMNLPALNLFLKYEAQFDPLKNSVSISHTELVINGVSTKISGTIENVFSVLSTKLNIQSEQTEVKKLIALIPKDESSLFEAYNIEGNLGFDFDLEYSEDNFVYFGIINLNQISVNYGDLPGKLFCNQAFVDVKNDNIRFNIKDGEFDGKPIKGHFTIDDFKNPFINVALAGSLNLKYVEPFLPNKNNHSIEGVASFDVKTSGLLADITNLKLHGELRSSHVSYNSDIMPEPLDSLEVEIYFDNETISIKKFRAATESGSFSLAGRVKFLMQYLIADSIQQSEYNPTIDAKLSGAVQLSLLNKILPAKGNPNLTGDLEVDLQLSGSVNELSLLKPFGKVSVRNGAYTDDLLPEKIERFDAQMTVMPDTIILHRLMAQFETSDASFKGKIINPFPYLLPVKSLDRKKIKKPLFVFTFASTHFDTDKLFPEAVPGVGEINKSASLDSISTLILPDIDGRGTFSIDTLIYSKVQLTSLNGKINVKNKKIDCYDVKGNVYSGKIAGNTTIDLNDFDNPQYVGQFNASQIEVNDFANRFSKFNNMIFGKVDMKGSYSAVGWEPEQFLNSLSMNSTSDIRQGKLYLSDEILLEVNQKLDKLIPKIQKEQTIRNLFSNIIIKDGNVTFDKLATNLGEFGELEIDGYYAFDGSMAYNGKIKLTKELTKKIMSKLTEKVTSKDNLLGDITKFLTKETSIGQIVLNPKFSGSIENPRFSLGVPSILK